MLLREVGLRGIGAAPLDTLRGRIVEAAPELVRGAIALIDSPRLPRDLDLASGMRTRRAEAPRSRLLDARLRALLKSHALAGGPAVRLSLFPTPLVGYFARCTQSTNCKPHLAAIARELLGPFILPASRAARPALSGGAVFTRFMLAGFACYRALVRIGVNPFESYPALVFNLWSSDGPVPPKRRGRGSLDARRAILERLRRVVGLKQPVAVANFDQADAAVLALAAAAAARRNSLVVLEHSAEGRFAVPMQSARGVPRA